IGDSVDNISSKFNALGAIGFSVLQRLTNAALDLGGRALNAVLGPIIEGGERRALNLEQARFQFKGLGLDVEAAMAAANEAVLGTAYGLDSAAKAAGQLAASQVPISGMTDVLKGIAGVAAMTSREFDDVSHIFTTVAG